MIIHIGDHLARFTVAPRAFTPDRVRLELTCAGRLYHSATMTSGQLREKRRELEKKLIEWATADLG